MGWNIGLNDKIGSLSHNSGVISLQPSLLTIGGRQYKTTSVLNRTISADVTLANNSLYFIYALVVGGSVQLRVSILTETAYLALNPASSLIGAFYTNNVAAFLTFTSIDGSQNKWQQKFLTANVSLNTTLGDLTFNNLVIGKTYRVFLYVILGDNTGPASQLNLDIYNGATFIQGSHHVSDDSAGISQGGYGVMSRPFIATATTVTFISSGLGGTDTILGTGSANATCATLEELPNHIPVTTWT